MFGDFGDFKIIHKINQFGYESRKLLKKKKIILCVPNTLIHFFKKKLVSKFISLGVQNCHYHEGYGPFTGSVNAAMLKKAGAEYIILGHSENRLEGESNKLIKKKIISSLNQKLNVVFCIGETLYEKRRNKTFSVLRKQIKSSLKKNFNMNKIIIAYEPVWSIGTNKIPKINELKNTIKDNPNSIFLSGGTDLSLNVTKGRKDIRNIISLNLIKELKFIKERKGNIEVGAATSLIEFELFIKKYYPDFNAILKRYGSVQIRNVGTIAGNIATASPIGDTLPLLLSLDAKVVLQKISKKTILPLNNFFVSYRKTKLKKGQFIHSIIIPIFKKNIFKAYKISKRIDDDISSVCASFNLEINNKKIKNIKIAYGGMAPIPKRAINCEKTLINSNLSEESFEKAKKNLEKDFSPINDTRATKDYRMEVAKNLLMKCFIEIKKKKLVRIN